MMHVHAGPGLCLAIYCVQALGGWEQQQTGMGMGTATDGDESEVPGKVHSSEQHSMDCA